MNQPLSDKCGDCFWWYEGPLLCEVCPYNPESETMKIPCSLCKKILSVIEFYEIHFEEGGPHFLCSKECKNKWEGLWTIKKALGNRQ
jgi:hypothetical protein